MGRWLSQQEYINIETNVLSLYNKQLSNNDIMHQTGLKRTRIQQVLTKNNLHANQNRKNLDFQIKLNLDRNWKRIKQEE